jgi:hypothetical protein
MARRRPVIKEPRESTAMFRIHGDVALCGAADVDLSIVSSQEGEEVSRPAANAVSGKIRGVSATATSRNCGREFVHSTDLHYDCPVSPKSRVA